jgi:hypothetical protein
MSDLQLETEQLNTAFDKCKYIVYDKRIVDKITNSTEREAMFVFLVVLLYSIANQLKKSGANIGECYEDLQRKDDVIELLRYIRNAACHIESSKNINAGYYRFNIHLGTVGQYKDDATIYFGEYYVLYWRHIVRLMVEIGNAIGSKVDVKETMVCL